MGPPASWNFVGSSVSSCVADWACTVNLGSSLIRLSEAASVHLSYWLEDDEYRLTCAQHTSVSVLTIVL